MTLESHHKMKNQNWHFENTVPNKFWKLKISLLFLKGVNLQDQNENMRVRNDKVLKFQEILVLGLILH